ncbi:MAG: LysM peptidoglycan-binding domain-containing protein, partial [Burkholderiaceae bacterium]|nr:LysM peptidoglycan-binding domain-containing protein [Burkholderiaceae bacterium]
VPEQSNLRQITYRVRRGDTLASVARRWGVRPEEIAAWNNLHGGALFAGQRLTLTVARAPAARPQPKSVRTAAAPRRKSGVVQTSSARGPARAASALSARR